MLEPEEPEALEPELSPDDCPGKEESLTLEPVLSEPDDDINEPKLSPDESDEPDDESHAVHDDVVVTFGAAVTFEAFAVVAFGAAVVELPTLACSCG
jgi:hypothetical protein